MTRNPSARTIMTAATLLAGVWGAAGGPAGAAAQGAATLVALSDYTNAGYHDVAIGRDGVIHAVWQDMAPGINRRQIFYSASRDGMRWTNPVALSEPGQNATQVRVAIDGQARVYVVWKTWNGGNSAGPELNPTNTLGSIFGSLRYRVLEGGRWSPVVPVGRENNVFAFFSSVDPSGRVHVVWSENSDPDRQSATPWLDWANTVRQTTLDGGSAKPAGVVGSANVGLHALDGFVDGAGRARFVAIGNQRLLHWNGGRFSTLLEGLRGDTNDAARLLRDGQGNEHLIFHRAGDGTIMELPVGGGAQPRLVFRAPGPGGRITGFQARQGSDGRMILAVQVEQASRTADLFVMSSAGSGWSAPVNVTNNGAGDRSAGYIAPGGARLVGVVAWSARFASAAIEPSGAVALLVTNLRSTTSTRNDLIDFRGGWSSPQVYFTRIGGAGARPAPAPAPAPAPPPAPAPTPAPAPATGGLPAGQYRCHYNSPYAGPIPTARTVTILAGGRYQSFDGGSGTYQFNPQSETVQWTSGPFAGAVRAEFLRGGDGRPTIRVVTGNASEDPSHQNFCVLHN